MHYSCPCVFVCVSVFWSVICEFIFIAEQMLHRQTALPCAVCCSCRRRNTQKVANKAKYPIDSCCACLCTCLYKCINVVNTHTHTPHTYKHTQLLQMAALVMAKSNCDCKHNLLKLAAQVFALSFSSPFAILLLIPFSLFLHIFLYTFVCCLFKIVIVSTLHIFCFVSLYKSTQCEFLCIHRCFF